MFDDNRSRKVVLVAHCILNQNSISDGTADYPSQFSAVVDQLIKERIGLLQLPCPELACLGLDRQDIEGGKRPLLEENTRIRALMNRKGNRELLRKRAKEVVSQVKEYKHHGIEVVGLIGVNRSPSCGVETTTSQNAESQGCGVFIELIRETLRNDGLGMKMIGVKTSQTEESVERVKELINRTLEA
jgi:predicted secreted protein